MDGALSWDAVVHMRETPIAVAVAQADARKGDYRAHPVDLNGPAQAEPLVEVTGLGIAGANHYYRADNPPYYAQIAGSVEGLWLRAGVAERLARVQARIAGLGLSLWVYDAWRPVAVQNTFHDRWMPDYLRRTRGLEGEALWAEVGRYWARGAQDGVIDPLSPPPHATGGAVDLTLRDRFGAPLHMGAIFDDVTAVSNTAHFETAPKDASFSDLEARANRRLLFHLMSAEGLVNNPTEWWHFSYGDQMWARITGAEAAVYGPAHPGAAT
ncbi:M15 family metallopeptidase [Tropicimonas sp. S265A]|uniref:M15 family metallopeptidase n=1 Tax=Tropicimonas sp. S265A TaxID=3415134 RepID=UPI003C7AD5AD